MFGRYIFIFSLSAFLLLPAVFLSADNIAGGHRGAITALVHTGEYVISAGEDGFMGIWSVNEKCAKERFQLTTFGIIAMVKNPFEEEICVIENGGIDQYRISAWNYKEKKKLFSLPSSEPVTYINYSAGGSYIIAGGFDGEDLVFLKSLTGEVVSAHELSGTPALAITGAAERNMLVYQPRSFNSGVISYIDLTTAAKTGSYRAPANLSGVIIFGNNRFIAGINRDGLLLVDASSGEILDTLKNFRTGALICPGGSGFHCINRENNRYVLYSFTIDRSRRLLQNRRLELPANDVYKSGVSDENGALFEDVTSIGSGAPGETGASDVMFATVNGNLYLTGQNSEVTLMAHNNQRRITEAAAGRVKIAVLTEKSELFFLPGDYRHLEENQTLPFKNKKGYTRITAIPSSPAEEGAVNEFILWQSANTQLVPQIVYSSHEKNELNLNFTLRRVPIRSISALYNKILILDNAGNIAVYNMDKTTPQFTFSAIGAIDAQIINERYFIVCRSIMGGNSPFLYINYNTGETVPVFLQSNGVVTAGITAYSGDSGNVYAASVEVDSDGAKTNVISLTSFPSQKINYILSIDGEDTHLSMAEAGGVFAAASGGKAAIYADNTADFERTNALPVKVLGSGDFFISLCSDGSIAWHDKNTGETLAILTLYEDTWVLQSDNKKSGKITGP